ncbi:unnamed protein product [Ambrosiozyma monospora]|uniref:Unnamed protein product n=1 Tax=Ambrosiozyma monospora TaxID=43982 RepID=A0ACB5U8H2_AMBMO|nr:unnamed protein product [Ambrosiozyma monospora]
MSSPFEDAPNIEQQPYRDSPEFDGINTNLSNRLLEINNLLNNLHRNLNYLHECMDNDDNYGGKIEKFQKTSSGLISKLVPLFKSLSSVSKKLNDLDPELLNKSQVFVKDKLNLSVKKSLQQFNELQNVFTELDKELNERNLQLIQEQEDASKQQQGTDAQQQQDQHQHQQQRVIIEYEPVNAEELE